MLSPIQRNEAFATGTSIAKFDSAQMDALGIVLEENRTLDRIRGGYGNKPFVGIYKNDLRIDKPGSNGILYPVSLRMTESKPIEEYGRSTGDKFGMLADIQMDKTVEEALARLKKGCPDMKNQELIKRQRLLYFMNIDFSDGTTRSYTMSVFKRTPYSKLVEQIY